METETGLMPEQLKEAENNLLALKQNYYPGRGLIAGLDESGKKLIQVYWLMGRSDKSRNRIFVDEGYGVVKTALADTSQDDGDNDLIIYRAMTQRQKYVVSNGNQTDFIDREGIRELLVNDWAYEPDSPNFTPRISSDFVWLGGENLLMGDVLIKRCVAEISILKKSSLNEMADEHLFRKSLAPGFGHCVTTYQGDGKPLPAFQGEPYLLPLQGEIENVAETIWKNLNPENRVALVAKFIDPESEEIKIKIINKYKAVNKAE